MATILGSVTFLGWLYVLVAIFLAFAAWCYAQEADESGSWWYGVTACLVMGAAFFFGGLGVRIING